MKRTPFYELHLKAGAKMSSAGWALPLEYTSVAQEHQAVRQCAGLTDFSSMGEIDLKGSEAFALLQKLLVNDVARLAPGKAMYSTMCNADGGIVDDTTVYCHAPNHYWIVTSTANRMKDVAWVQEQAKGMNVAVTDISSGIGLLCLQGPCSREILQPITDADLSELHYFEFVKAKVKDVPVWISRTGFTGELGYELYVGAEDAQELWENLLAAGEPRGLTLCGLGAAGNTLPLEKGYLSGREYNESISPIEAGLGWTVRLNKGDFIGREALKAIKEKGPQRRLMGFELNDASKVAKSGATILANGQAVGKVTSASFGPSVGKSIGLGYVQAEHAAIGTEVEIDVDGVRFPGRLVNKRFYDPDNLRLHS